MEYIKIKVDEAKYLEIKDFYQAKLINDSKRPYDLFEVKLNNGIQVKAYSSKGLYTILFAGDKNKIELEASIFVNQPQLLKKKVIKTSSGWEDTSLQIGSDEVGVGDFFQGFYIASTLIKNEDINFIDSLGVTDSKKMTDAKIMQIGPILREKIPNHIVIISAEKLTSLEDKGWSTHKILANGHNLAHKKLIDQYHIKNDVKVYIDQFEKEAIYKRYVIDNQLIDNHLIFQTKGESFYPSIAAASVIARYVFLCDWQKMEHDLGCTIPKGASHEVDKVYIKLLKKYGREKLDPYVKKFFRNYKTNV